MSERRMAVFRVLRSVYVEQQEPWMTRTLQQVVSRGRTGGAATCLGKIYGAKPVSEGTRLLWRRLSSRFMNVKSKYNRRTLLRAILYITELLIGINVLRQGDAKAAARK